MPRKVKRTYDLLKDPRWLKMQYMHNPDINNPDPVKRNAALVHLGESPLTWLYSRGHLNERQLIAGERLRFDFERAAMSPRVTMNWDSIKTGRISGSAAQDAPINDRILSAKERFDQALLILGRDLSDIAWRVICSGEAIAGAERALGWPVRSGKVVLRIALDRLAAHYRLPEMGGSQKS
jgi:Domain of unknown function (DUF6456)